MNGSRQPGSVPSSPAGLESTTVLLAQVRAGDLRARDRLVRRYLPILQRWARGRLPSGARPLADTGDLVQETMVRALGALDRFEPRREGAFLAYLRRILTNRIRDHYRSAASTPPLEPVDDDLRAPTCSPLETAIGKQSLEAYDRALERLSDEQREAVILRIEFDYSYPQIAEALDIPSANAARMKVSRALVRLAEVLNA